MTRRELKRLLDYDPTTGVFRWKVSLSPIVQVGDAAGTLTKWGYITIVIRYMHYRANRLAWFYVTGKWPKAYVDHVNRDRADNRFANLREATNSQNQANRVVLMATNTSGHKGVSWYKPNRKWRAMINVNRRSVYLGLFATVEEAGAAYAAAALKHFGEFARTA